MKMCNISTCLRTISANLVLSAMFVLSCTAFAQTVRYRAVEDPGQNLISLGNVARAFAFAFDSKKFSDLWPDYGYNFNDIAGDTGNLCVGRNRNIGIGRSAIARDDPLTQDQEEFIALPLGNDTSLEIVQEFLDAQNFSNGQATEATGSDDSTDDFGTLTIGDMCRILSEPGNDRPALANTVIVTQHPLPVSESYTYRLLEE